MNNQVAAIGLCIGFVILGAASTNAASGAAISASPLVVAQAMIPPTGMGDADRQMAQEERMRRRFPQPVRVGDLIGLPILDNDERTIGYVRQVVRTADDRIKLIVAYSRWCGWCGFDARPVAVPIEAVGMLGRQVASLDMPPSEYAAAPTWQGTGATVLKNDDSVRVALARL